METKNQTPPYGNNPSRKQSMILKRAHRQLRLVASKHHRAFSTGTKLVILPEATVLDPSSDEEFASHVRSFYQHESPVVIRRSAIDFPAVEKWKNLDYLVDTIGDMDFEAELGQYNQGEKAPLSFHQYAEYLRLFEESERKDEDAVKIYMAQNDLPKALLEDIKIPRLCTDASLGVGHGRLYNTNLWIGPRGCTSCLHYDPLDNFLIQIVGTKEVFLLDKATDSTLLYTGAKYGQQNNTSAVNVENPDHDKHPRFAKHVSGGGGGGGVWHVALIPGDILFIPQKWWHATVCKTYSISVNTWWR